MGGENIENLNSIPSNNVLHVLGVAAEHGEDLKDCAATAGINPDQLGNHQDISAQQYYQFLSLALAATNIEAFAIKVGQKFSIVDYGVLGYACISSATLEQSLNTFFRFQQILGSGASFHEQMIRRQDQVAIQILSPCTDQKLYRFDILEAISQWITAANQFWANEGLRFHSVNLSFDPSPLDGDLASLLNCEVNSGQAQNELLFDAALLDQPIAGANEVTAQLCEQQCYTILSKLRQQPGLVEQVRRLIINGPGKNHDPEDIAAHLNMSYRTLRRRLSEAGTSFRAIQNEVRMGLAQDYLSQSELTTQEIAYLLGYSEATNFHRAFRQWHGQTPGDYRKRQVGL